LELLHWNGSLLDSVETVLQFAQTLSFKGKNPVVTLIEKVYNTGVTADFDQTNHSKFLKVLQSNTFKNLLVRV